MPNVETLYIKNHSVYIVNDMVKWSDHLGEQGALHQFEQLHFLYTLDQPFYSDLRESLVLCVRKYKQVYLQPHYL